MSAPMNALAVLRDHLAGIREAHKWARGKNRDEIAAGADEFEQAIDAVAELIEAATDQLETGFNVAQTPSRRRLSAALARVGGAS